MRLFYGVKRNRGYLEILILLLRRITGRLSLPCTLGEAHSSKDSNGKVDTPSFSV